MKNFKTCVKGLRGFIKPVRGRILVSCLIGVARIAASMAFVWICKRLVDIATGVTDAPLGQHVAIMCGIMLAQVITSVAFNYWEGLITVRTQNSFRADTFAHVINSRWDGREAFHSGDTVNRLEEDIRVVVDLICTNLPDFIITICQLIAASTFLLLLEPQLLWVLLIIMPVAILGSKMFFRKMRVLTEHIRKRDSDVQQLMQENLQNRILIKTLGRAERLFDRLGWLQQDIEDSTVKRLNYNAVARTFMRFGFTAGYASAFLWGIFGIRNGAVTYGMMTAFLQLVGQVQGPIANISRHIPAFIHSLTSVERLMELNELPLENEEKPVILEGAPGIKVEHLTFAYADAQPGTEPVLKDFSHDFTPGSVTAIMGVTGAGKSTLTKLIMALLEPSQGSVTLYSQGKCVQSGNGTRGNFMYVPQGNSLMSGTVRENLLLACPDATEEQMREALHLAVADFILEMPQGLDTSCSERGSGLSEGQAQRIAIARALLHTGGVLILDEATSALDADTERLLLERLSEHFHGTKTIIWITHRDSITHFAGSILKI